MRSRRPRILWSVFLGLLLLSGLGSALHATGASAGTLDPPHADVGVDTNGDRAFNYLRIDVGVEVAASGSFTVRVVLKDDLDLATLTDASTAQTLSVGGQRVAVSLVGSDIYAGGVDGPYFAHLSLLDGSGAVVSTGVHTTAAYRFTDFQAFDARFVPPVSDRTIDDDADGLANWIELRFVVDVATAGRYRLLSHLTDTTYTLSEDVTSIRDLVPGRYDWNVRFLAYPLRLQARSGPYLVTNSLYDSRDVLIDFVFLETAAYSYTTLETPPGWFAAPPTSQGVDSDGDGLFNSLRVTAALGFELAGNYTLSGRLFTGAGTMIGDAVARLVVPLGAYSASLSFDGSAIFDSGADGPYRIDLQLYDEALRRLDTETAWTSAYRRLEFQPRLLYLDPPHSDFGVDADGDGKFEVLRLRVGAFFNVAGSGRIVAGLSEGRVSPNFTEASAVVDRPAGAQTVDVDVGGAAIVAAGISGFFHARLSAFDAQGSLLDTGEFYTHEYAPSDFEVPVLGRILGPLSEWGEDLDGNGLLNRLQFQIRANASAYGRYRLDAALSSGATTVTTTSTIVTLDANPSVVPLRFSGKEIRSASRDGPYDLAVTLREADGGVLDSASFVSAAYAAGQFEAAAPATLSGRVSSQLDGTALASATVWLLDYSNHVSRVATTDASGRYAVGAFIGTYDFIVDHTAGQAHVSTARLTGTDSLDLALGPPRQMSAESDLIWTGWNALFIRVRHLYEEDRPALSFRFDWWNGNRDGWVQPSEVQGLLSPPDALLEAVVGGDTGARLRAGGVEYVATDALATSDGRPGPVDPGRAIVVTMSRSFVSRFAIGAPPQITISIKAYYDNEAVDYGLWLYPPSAYRYSTVTASYGVRVFARTIPYLVDPRLGTGSAGSSIVGTVDLELIPQTYYSGSAPGSPLGVSATVSGYVVTLAWHRPLEDVDGGPLTNLAGYRVYRASGPSGSYVQINGPLVPSEGFSDSPGVGTFYYVVRALNTDGIEGPPSAAASAAVPTFAPSAGSAPGDRSWGGIGGVDGAWILWGLAVAGSGGALTLAWMRRARTRAARPAPGAPLGGAGPRGPLGCNHSR